VIGKYGRSGEDTGSARSRLRCSGHVSMSSPSTCAHTAKDHHSRRRPDGRWRQAPKVLRYIENTGPRALPTLVRRESASATKSLAPMIESGHEGPGLLAAKSGRRRGLVSESAGREAVSFLSAGLQADLLDKTRIYKEVRRDRVGGASQRGGKSAWTPPMPTSPSRRLSLTILCSPTSTRRRCLTGLRGVDQRR